MRQMALLVVLFCVTVAIVAPAIVKRSGPAKYDNQMDAGVLGEGDLEHKSGLFVGFDGKYLFFTDKTSDETEWKFTSDHRWVHVKDNKCVHPEGGSHYPADETKLVLEDCDPAQPSRIRFTGLKDGGYWNIQHLDSNKCIHPLYGTARVGVYLVLWSECGRADKLDFIFEDVNMNKIPME